MKTASTVLLSLSIVFTTVGFIPCLGWLNWIGIPVSVTCAAIGIAGLVSGKDPTTAEEENQGLYLTAVIVGLSLIVVGAVRCLMGAGFF